MKKNTKFLVLIMALLIMCLCLTGCDELDTMREQQAFWTETGKGDSITLNGVEYKKLDTINPPNPIYNNYITTPVYVTDSDVPVLLSRGFSVYLNLSEDKSFIHGYVYDNYYNEVYDVYTGSGGEAVYCKAEIYDEVMSKIDAGIEYTNYGFGYYYWDEEEMIDNWEYYYLSADEAEAVNKVIKDVKPVTNSEVVYNNTYVTYLDRVSDDKYFGKTGYEIYTDGLNTYYLVQYSETLDIHTYYKVPEELNNVFENLKTIASGEGFRRIE